MKGIGQIIVAGTFLSLAYSDFSQAEEVADQRDLLGEKCYDVLHNSESQKSSEVDECKNKYLTLVVTATRTEKQIKNVPASVTVIDSKKIERNPSESIAEALRDVPGVEISDAGQAGLKRITLRGEEPRRVAILIDGQEFYDPRDVGTPLLISPESVERIEVIRGPASVLYGSRAIGGVINIITKKGGYHPLQATFSSQYDSSAQGLQEYGSFYGSYFDFDYRLSGTFADYEDRDTPRGELDNTSFSNNSGAAYLAKRFEKSTIAFQYDQFNSDNNVYVDPRVASTPPLVDFKIDVPQRDREKFAWFYDYRGEKENLERVHLDVYIQESERDFNTDSITAIEAPAPTLTNTRILSGSQINTAGGTGQFDIRPGESHLITVGAQFVNDDLDQSRNREVTIAGISNPPDNIIDRASQSSYAVFAQDEWKITDNLAVAPGIRNYWIESELDETTRLGLSPNSNSDDHIIGSISLTYTGIDNTTLWGKVGQGYVYPSLVELQTGAFAGPSFVNPNQNLDPETSVSYDIGARFDTDLLSVDTSFFYSQSEDYIDHVLCSAATARCIEPATSRDRVYVNVNEARTFGAEGTVSFDLDDITPYSSLTWQRRRFETAEYTTYDSGLPILSSRTGIRYEYPLGSASLLWTDLFIRMSSDSTEKESVSEDLRRAGWSTLNLAAGLEFGDKSQYRLVAEVVNIFDKAYTPAQENLTAPGTSALVKLVANL